MSTFCSHGLSLVSPMSYLMQQSLLISTNISKRLKCRLKHTLHNEFFKLMCVMKRTEVVDLTSRATALFSGEIRDPEQL